MVPDGKRMVRQKARRTLHSIFHIQTWLSAMWQLQEIPSVGGAAAGATVVAKAAGVGLRRQRTTHPEAFGLCSLKL